jgi:hypothetical protein
MRPWLFSTGLTDCLIHPVAGSFVPSLPSFRLIIRPRRTSILSLLESCNFSCPCHSYDRRYNYLSSRTSDRG